MSDNAGKLSEEQIATRRNLQRQQEFIVSRNRFIFGSVVCFLATGVMVYFDLPMMVLVLGGLGLICVLQAYDANMMLQSVRSRSTKTLWPRISKLQRPERDSPAKSPAS